MEREKRREGDGREKEEREQGKRKGGREGGRKGGRKGEKERYKINVETKSKRSKVVSTNANQLL